MKMRISPQNTNFKITNLSVTYSSLSYTLSVYLIYI